MELVLAAALAHFIALLSPGPDFLLIVRSAIKNKTFIALGVVLGITVANGVYIILCIMGVGIMVAKSASLMIFLKLFGGLFLTYIAYCALRAKKESYQSLVESIDEHTIEKTSGRFSKEFLAGFASGLFNPKNLLFYLSLFTVVLTPEISILLKTALGIWMIFAVFLWDAVIVVILSHQRMQNIFAKIAFYIDKLAGILLGAVGLNIIASAVKDIKEY